MGGTASRVVMTVFVSRCGPPPRRPSALGDEMYARKIRALGGGRSPRQVRRPRRKHRVLAIASELRDACEAPVGR